MKLVVDAALCQGYGLCHDEAPDLLELDEFGYAGTISEGLVVPERMSAAEAAVGICPARALRLVD